MKNKTSICPSIKELERIYDFFAKQYGLDKITKRPVITIQSHGHQKNTLGWYWKNKWQYNKQKLSEINICAESLSEKATETLIHEIVHYHNASLNILDCNAHNYHNKNFKSRAETYGLNVKNSGRHGWSNTSISESLQKIIDKVNIKKEIFILYRKKNKTSKLTTKMIKYNCDCTIVRCATNLQAKCKTCEKDFERGS